MTSIKTYHITLHENILPYALATEFISLCHSSNRLAFYRIQLGNTTIVCPSSLGAVSNPLFRAMHGCPSSPLWSLCRSIQSILGPSSAFCHTPHQRCGSLVLLPVIRGLTLALTILSVTPEFVTRKNDTRQTGCFGLSGFIVYSRSFTIISIGNVQIRINSPWET